jgi:hypothetical protein
LLTLEHLVQRARLGILAHPRSKFCQGSGCKRAGRQKLFDKLFSLLYTILFIGRRISIDRLWFVFVSGFFESQQFGFRIIVLDQINPTTARINPRRTATAGVAEHQIQ